MLRMPQEGFMLSNVAPITWGLHSSAMFLVSFQYISCMLFSTCGFCHYDHTLERELTSMESDYLQISLFIMASPDIVIIYHIHHWHLVSCVPPVTIRPATSFGINGAIIRKLLNDISRIDERYGVPSESAMPMTGVARNPAEW